MCVWGGGGRGLVGVDMLYADRWADSNTDDVILQQVSVDYINYFIILLFHLLYKEGYLN